MSLYVTIAAAVTIAVTAKLMYLLFLSGRTITNATLFGRLVARIEPARRAFVDGWRTQDWGYLLRVWPCMLASMGLVSLLLKWMMPAMDGAQSVGDKIRYCLLVFGVGVSASLTLSFLLVMMLYYAASVVKAWWHPSADEVSGPPASGEAEAEGDADRAE